MKHFIQMVVLKRLAKSMFESVIVGAMLFGAGNAFAISLDDAKQQGLVGEQASGYLAVRVSSPEVESLVREINTKRRDEYQRIASKNGTPVAAVEGLAGKKAIDRTGSGQYVRNTSGEWVKK